MSDKSRTDLWAEELKAEGKEECLKKIKEEKCLEQYIEGYKYGYRDGYKSAIKEVNIQIKNQGGVDAKPGWWWWPWK